MGYKNILITHCFIWSQRAELNRRPTDYESVALPLSYAGLWSSMVRNGVLYTLCPVKINPLTENKHHSLQLSKPNV